MFLAFEESGVMNKNKISDTLLMKRNNELYSRLLERKKAPDRKIERLPISLYRKQIADAIEKNQVLVIKGEPGCGKSTQVPQIIIDYFTEKMKGTDCNIVITQPRRISAITLAERVASERHEMVFLIFCLIPILFVHEIHVFVM